MFYIAKDNLPFRRAKRQRAVLSNSAEDNTQMIVNLASSLTDMAGIVKDLSQQVVDLTAMVAEQGEDDEDEE